MDGEKIGMYLGYFVGFIAIFLMAGKVALHQLIEKTKEVHQLQAQDTKSKFTTIQSDMRDLKLGFGSLKDEVTRIEKTILVSNADVKALQVDVARIEKIIDRITQVNVVTEANRLEEKPLSEGRFRITTKKKP